MGKWFKIFNISYRDQNINYKDIGKIKNGKRLNDDSLYKFNS